MRAFTNNTVSPNVQPSFPFLDITALLSIVSKLRKSLNDIKKLYKNGFVAAAVAGLNAHQNSVRILQVCHVIKL